MISSIEQKTEASARKQQLAREYRERVEKELREICYEVLVSVKLNGIELYWIAQRQMFAKLVTLMKLMNNE